MKNIVDKLDGYLHSLRRLSIKDTDYWASHLFLEGTLIETLNNYFFTLHFPDEIDRVVKIDYNEIEVIFDKFIGQNIEVNDDQLDLLLWDIVEYYGIASTTLDPKGVFNPLVSNGAYRIYLKEDRKSFHSEYAYFACPIQKQVILTGFGFR